MTTIYAPSNNTISSIKIIRISGPQAKTIPQIFNFKMPKPRVFSVRKLYVDNKVIDHSVVVWLPGPKTVTGEDVFELHIHGSIAIEEKIYHELSVHDKFRIADKGEFTKRSVLNGVIDLTQAEAINDIINSETEKQLEIANMQFEGLLKNRVYKWRAKIVSLQSILESLIDFVDEELPEDIEKKFKKDINVLSVELTNFLENSRYFKKLKDGFLISIIGKPNVGKSSLINYLTKEDVAIVTDIPGTTRDIIEQRINLDGYNIILCDSAGLRQTKSLIEKEGIKKTNNLIHKSRFIINLSTDGNFDLPNSKFKHNLIKVRSKKDIIKQKFVDEDISISTKTGQGIKELMKIILDELKKTKPDNMSLLTTQRQIKCISDILVVMSRIKRLSLKKSTELVAEELRVISTLLRSISNPIDVDDVLDEIFSKFCIGK